MTHRLPTLACAATLALALGACSGQTKPAPATPTAPPAASSSAVSPSATSAAGESPSAQGQQTVQAPGFTIVLPSSWHEDASASPSAPAGLGSMENITYVDPSAASDGVVPELRGLRVATVPAGLDLTTLIDQMLDKVASNGSGTVTRLGTLTVDGEQGQVVGGLDDQTATYDVAMLVQHGGQVYGLLLREPQSVSKDDAKQRFDAIVQTWKWTA